MQQSYKRNFFIFTGGPGVGKTSLLTELQHRGYNGVREVARDILKAQYLTGGNATHQGDRVAYLQLMLERSLVDFKGLLSTDDLVFFDRGLPDLYSYSRRFCGHEFAEVDQAIVEYRYNSKVFIFPPWPEIYCHDTERKQTFAEAVETYAAVKQGYGECGYELIEVPKISIVQRADFILTEVAKIQRLIFISLSLWRRCFYRYICFFICLV